MLIFKPIKRIFLPENLENSRGGVNLQAENYLPLNVRKWSLNRRYYKEQY